RALARRQKGAADDGRDVQSAGQRAVAAAPFVFAASRSLNPCRASSIARRSSRSAVVMMRRRLLKDSRRACSLFAKSGAWQFISSSRRDCRQLRSFDSCWIISEPRPALDLRPLCRWMLRGSGNGADMQEKSSGEALPQLAHNTEQIHTEPEVARS